MDLELIKTEIAQKDGFDTWSQMVECLCTTEPGLRVIDKNITDLVRRAVADSTGKRQTNTPDVMASAFVRAFVDWSKKYPKGRIYSLRSKEGMQMMQDLDALSDSAEAMIKHLP